MTFEEVDEIICSYGFYRCSLDDSLHKSMYYLYPGIDRLAIYTEKLYEHNLNSLDKKHYSTIEFNEVDSVVFSPIVLWSTGVIGINYANDSLKLCRKNTHTTHTFKLSKVRLNKELKNFKSSLESLLQEQKIMKINRKLKKMETDF